MHIKPNVGRISLRELGVMSSVTWQMKMIPSALAKKVHFFVIPA